MTFPFLIQTVCVRAAHRHSCAIVEASFVEAHLSQSSTSSSLPVSPPVVYSVSYWESSSSGLRLRLLPLLAEGLRPPAISSEGLELVPPTWEKTSDGWLVVLSEYLQNKDTRKILVSFLNWSSLGPLEEKNKKSWGLEKLFSQSVFYHEQHEYCSAKVISVSHQSFYICVFSFLEKEKNAQ